MKNVIAVGHPRLARRGTIHLVLALVFAIFVAGCGDDSSTSSDPASESQSSSSVTLSEVEGSSSSVGREKSSSSVKSGDDSQKSSSSKKGNSSSSNDKDNQSSSSDVSVKICNEGDLDTAVRGTMTIFYECRNGLWEVVSYARSSSSSIPSSDAHYDMTEQFYCNGSPDGCENMSDDYIDPRDQHVYKTFLYQKKKNGEYLYRFRIFASNLNYGKQIMGNVSNSDDNVVEKYCYNDDEWYCDNGFGGMYTWSEAMGLPKACDSLYVDSSAACIDRYVPPEGHTVKLGADVQRQGICPDGWHIMNDWEWRQFSEWGGHALHSPVVWSGPNYLSFSALPTGVLNNGKYEGLGIVAQFWKPQEENDVRAMRLEVGNNFQTNLTPSKSGAVSVRCVEDYEDPFWK
jgi:uncharacterized protein (TIGR02145 family)